MKRLNPLESLGTGTGLIYNLLTGAALFGTAVVGMLLLTVLVNPNAGINPFPPPTQPAIAKFPTPTNTSEFPTLPPAWTSTPITPTETLTPSPTPTDTETPTETFTPGPTDTPAPTRPPSRTPTNTPTVTRTSPPVTATAPAPSATATPKEFTSQGIRGDAFWVENPSAGAGADIWFNFKVTNTTDAPVSFSVLAAHADNGPSAQSWTNASLGAHQVLEWRDHINIAAPGTYGLYLGICYGGKDACLNNQAAWTRLSPSVAVTVH